ncbi:protein kinase family protein [Marinobacter salinexigens]|uniref:Protein kinase family protein n=1 Tax=Marinobacter salinexigens TaxID=2919747 RepID=A0A5B0V8E4_9GAMM|nr:protein kinase family protein [Marinobacter salinexigens]KAA1170401.1 protein kinase family protein [Marinobacter salinexigens]
MNGQANCPSLGLGLEPTKVNDTANQKWYKPIIAVDADSSGNKHVYKAFRFSHGLLGNYFRFLAGHEFRMLKSVEHLEFTPDQISRRSDASPTIHYRLIEGSSVKDVAACSGVPENFFSKLFSDVKTLHQHGVVHMDLGNSGNILVSGQGAPAIIDFGSAVPLRWLPSFVQSWACRKDILGVLKLWHRFDKESMPLFLLHYYQSHYRKNIYTPKRFLKAARRWLTGDAGNADLSGVTTVISVFFGLLVLVSFT